MRSVALGRAIPVSGKGMFSGVLLIKPFISVPMSGGVPVELVNVCLHFSMLKMYLHFSMLKKV